MSSLPQSQDSSQSLTHLHNDDLLTSDDARDFARRRFPEIIHILDNPALRLIFKPVDDTANRAKRRSHRAGLLAVVLASLSLWAGAAEPLWAHARSPWPTILTVLSAAAALIAVYVAAGWILFGRRKVEWLHGRLFTERLRQAHFQNFVSRLPQVTASLANAQAKEKYRTEREAWIAGFAAQLRGSLDGELAAILDPTRRPDIWMYKGSEAMELPPGETLPASLFDAYRTLRIDAQLAYADHKLSEGVWSPNFQRNSISLQQRQLNLVWSSALVLMVLLHLGLLIGPMSPVQVVSNSWTHILIAWLAFLALAAKTLQEGLGLRVEIARYQEYRTDILDIRARFELANSSEQRLRLMAEMETLVFREMRDFLRTHNEASFLL